MEPTGLWALLSRDAIVALLWGGGGGAVVAIVTRTAPAEMLGRIAVGGIVAAAGAPYLATEVLNMDTASHTYPFISCSLGVLGYQLVKSGLEDPTRIPVIGKLFLGQQAAPAPTLPPIPKSSPAVTTAAPERSWGEILERARDLPPERRRVRVPLT